MADDANAVDAEQRSAAEGTVVEAAEQALHRHQRLVPFHIQRADHVLIHLIHHELEDAFAQLQDDVAGEAIGHDHVGGTAVNVAALDVADEAILERAVAEEFVGLLNEFVAFALFLADVHEADGGPFATEHVAGEDGAHHAVFEEVARLREDVRADVEDHATALGRGHDGSDPRPMHALEEPLEPQATSHDRAGVTRTHEAFDVPFGHELPAAKDRGVRLLAECLDRLLFHIHGLRGVEDFEAIRKGRQKWFELGAVADQHDREVGDGGKGEQRPSHNWARTVVATHGIEREPHDLLPLRVLVHVHHFAALIGAAIGAHAVRHDRLIALRAELNLHGNDVVMAAAGALPRTGSASFGYCHDSPQKRSSNV